MTLCTLCGHQTVPFPGPRGPMRSCTNPLCVWSLAEWDGTYPCCACCKDGERTFWLGVCAETHDAPCDVCEQPYHPDDDDHYTKRNLTGQDPYGRTYSGPGDPNWTE